MAGSSQFAGNGLPSEREPIPAAALNVSPGSESTSIAALVTELRASILSGAYAAGDRLPSRTELAARTGLSPESASIALRQLRDEGLVTLEQGRGTYVRSLHQYSVTISSPAPDGPRRPSARAIRKTLRTHPAVSALDCSEDGMAWTLTVLASDPASAAATGLRAVGEAGVADVIPCSITVAPRP